MKKKTKTTTKTNFAQSEKVELPKSKTTVAHGEYENENETDTEKLERLEKEVAELKKKIEEENSPVGKWFAPVFDGELYATPGRCCESGFTHLLLHTKSLWANRVLSYSKGEYYLMPIDPKESFESIVERAKEYV